MLSEKSIHQKSQNLFGLAGKRILVTGASLGIGSEVARFCAAAGASLVITGRNEFRLSETLSSLEGDNHTLKICNLTDYGAVKKLVDELDSIDGVVHSAGIRGLSPMRIVDSKFLHEVFEINYFAPMLLTRELLFGRKINPCSSILFISSIAALTGTVGVGPYSGSKAALIGTLRPLALELAKRNIRVNAICPGLVETTLITEDPSWFEESRKKYPMNIGQPDDIAYACLYFLSDASIKVTGSVFSMDGGVELV
jgi:NAD(P)-dependent dehydrogenase (short-subunit alcohol dehydrogenase family)